MIHKNRVARANHLHLLKPLFESKQPPGSTTTSLPEQQLSKIGEEIKQSLTHVEKVLERSLKKSRRAGGSDTEFARLTTEIARLNRLLEQKSDSTELLQPVFHPVTPPPAGYWKKLNYYLHRAISLKTYRRLLFGTAHLSREDFDDFGRDPSFEKKVKPFFDFLYYRYWRVEAEGLENIPNRGRALLVANHSGTLPFDGSMIRLAITDDHPEKRDVRFLVENFVYYLPFLGTFMYRIGGVRAAQDNAERLLNKDHLVAVFPEGEKGIGKLYRHRYHLQRFGRGGFIKLALRTGAPIIPVAVIGAEETHPLLYRANFLAKPFGIPYVPITPTIPWLGPLGLIGLPAKWRIYFGKPILLDRYGKKAIEDELLVHRLSEKVRQTIQDMIMQGLKKRRSVWFR